MLGERLKQLMTEKGLTQSELARRVGVNQSTIAGLIAGKARSSSYLHRIAREVSTTPEYLLGETNDPRSAVPPAMVSSDELTWVRTLRCLAPANRAALLSFTQELARTTCVTSRKGGNGASAAAARR